ncbi:hypothetical protein F9L33_10320 [Amylibacter sp. SFDW26]|uniref:glycine betaine ABC transporter substrate-binding protein n=1 Tax=Amylibacter sp. SFDW26 TaxID=2652722 RepID=UPI001261B601|nr:glycine betaine ABC transporter substrate-binding protein [Amylibacter sp. SFDW26]KAB7613757.1 hypothetical protein F9L33_10320 [Amylibacter sp. SFDW26]
MQINNIMKSLTTVIGLGFTFPAMASDTVRMVLPSWDGGKYIAYNLAHEIKTVTGRNVEFVTMETDKMWIEMDKDDGEVDIFPDLWMPNQEHNWGKYVTTNKSVVHNDAPYEGKQGFYILNNDDGIGIKDLSGDILTDLDYDNNGLSEYWPGAPSWHAPVFNKVKLKSYGLYDKFEAINQDDKAFLTTLDERARSGDALMFYWWEPDWVHAKYLLKRIDEPEYVEGCKDITDPSESDDWLNKSKFGCAFPSSEVFVVFRDDFLEDDKLGTLLKNYKVNIERLQKDILVSKESGEDLKVLAEASE